MAGTRKRLSTLIAILTLTYPSLALADAYDDGAAAFRRKDYEAAMTDWQPLAEEENARAQAGIAALYHGGLGVKQDYSLAFHWCRKAAMHGEASAQYLLGSMYRDGTGAPKDVARALEWYRKAAEQDLHWAQYSLGLMYYKGEGVPSDDLQAYQWLALASTGRDPDDAQVNAAASYLLNEVSAKLTPEQIEQAKQRVSGWKPNQAVRDK
jgi:TPR repeat protein